MGTITRNFANNLTTSGLLKSSAFNNASFNNVTSVPGGSVTAGSMTLLSTQTASSSAFIEFTSNIDSTYDQYMFIFNHIHPSSDGADFGFQGSTNGGSSYGITLTSTHSRGYNAESGAPQGHSYEGSGHLVQSTSYQQILQGVGADADENASGILRLYNLSSSTYSKNFLASCTRIWNNPGAVSQFIGGYFNTTTAINAIRFQFSTGNVDDGVIQMFGIS